MKRFYRKVCDTWVNLNPWFRLVVGFVAAVVIYITAVRPGYAHFKNYQVRQRVNEAKDAVVVKDFAKARDLSLSALSSGEAGIAAYRVLQRAMSELNDPLKVDIARALVFHPGSGKQDRVEGFRSLCHDGPTAIAGQAWAYLGSESQREPEFAVPFADRLIDEGRLNEAAVVLKPFAGQDVDGPTAQTTYRLMISSGRSRDYENAQKLAVACIRASKTGGQSWIALLNRLPVFALNADILAPAWNVLLANAGAGEEEESLLLDAKLKIGNDFANRKERIDEVLADLREKQPVSLARLMEELGMQTSLMEMNLEDSISQYPRLGEVLLRAAVEAGNWDRAGVFLERMPETMPASMKLAWRSRLEIGKGDRAAGDIAWSRAMDEATSDNQTNPFLSLYDFAVRHEMVEQGDTALVTAVMLGRGRLPLYRDVKDTIMRLEKSGKDKVLMEMCAGYLAIEPGNPVLVTQYAYLASLNDLADLSAITRAMEILADALPNELPVQCVLATAYLCDHRYSEAKKVLDALHVPDVSRLGLPFQALFIVVDVVTGKIDREDKLVKTFPWGKLQPSEQRRFMELIQGAHQAKDDQQE